MVTAMKLESGPFPSRDGTRLYGEWHHPTGTPRGVALVLHGYADHGGRYVEVSQKLAGLGLAALAMDYRGHGRADGKRGHCSSFVEYLDDLDAALARVRAAVPNGPLLLVSHSHGALVALRALCDPTRTPKIDAVALSSPFLGIGMPVPQAKIIAGKIVSRIIPSLALPNGLRVEDFTHDEDIKRATLADNLRHSVATARWFTEASAAQEYVQANVGRLAVPSLWLVGGADPVVSVEATKRAYANAGGDKQIRLYEGYFHEIFNEIGRANVFNDLTQWISSRFLTS
jgi:lysophospholipase